ncbi:MAG: hypothetical protein OHK0039_29220 [Bacteroidia bacterium]
MENTQIAQLTLGSLITLFTQEALKTSTSEAIKSLKDFLVKRFSGKKEAEKYQFAA